MTPTEATLAALLFLQTPGKSPYSTIVVEPCDERCQSTPLCDEPVLYCRPPRHSVPRGGWVRNERFDEGLARYAMIAEVITEVAQVSTWQPHDSCEAPSHRSEGEPSAQCEALQRRRPWTGSERQLRLLLSSVIAHESSLRRDVHEGSTRGDCDYVESGGQRRMVEGSCRSHCLGQVMVEGDDRTRRGYQADDLVGLGRDATRRCLETVTDRLSYAHGVCSEGAFGSRGMRPACVFGLYGAVPGWARDPRIASRTETYLELRSLRRPLPPRVLEALELIDGEAPGISEPKP